MLTACLGNCTRDSVFGTMRGSCLRARKIGAWLGESKQSESGAVDNPQLLLLLKDRPFLESCPL